MKSNILLLSDLGSFLNTSGLLFLFLFLAVGRHTMFD